MIKSAVIFLALLLMGVVIYFLPGWRHQREQITSSQNSPTSITAVPVTKTTKIPSSWKKHESDLFGYSFSYPDNWHFFKYDEENHSVVAGSHTLNSYDPLSAENFMDHGIINWQKFLGEKIAIKTDLSVRRISQSHAEFLDEFFKEGTLQPSSELKFGNIETFQYNTPDAISDQLVRSFVAFPDQDRVATANVFVYYQPNQVILEDTTEWKELEEIFLTFQFYSSSLSPTLTRE